jgi:hypothetical protein
MEMPAIPPETDADAPADGTYLGSDARQLYRSSILDEEQLVAACQQEVASRRKTKRPQLEKEEKLNIAQRVLSIGLR